MKIQIVANASRRKNERGNVLAYTVLSALFLFFAVGLGVDLSHLYLAKTELQNSADAGALAGASALKLPITDPSTGQPYRIPAAVDRALATLNQNKYNFDNKDFVTASGWSLAAQRALVRFAVNLSEFDGGNGLSEAQAIASPDTIRFVRVITPPVPVSIIFAAPLLGSLQTLDARAVAGLSVPGNVNYCPAPLSAVQCDTSVDPNCTLDDPNNPCDPSNPVTCKYWGNCPGAPGTEHDIQTYTRADGTTYTCDPKKEFCKRCTYVIRAEGQNGGGPAAGNYQILRCAGSGKDEVRDALAGYADNCRCGNIDPGEDIEINTDPGVAGGPVSQGLNVRFDCYQGSSAPHCSGGSNIPYSATVPPDTNIAYGSMSGTGNNTIFSGVSRAQYLGTQVSPETAVSAVAPSNPGVVDRRVLILPIINNWAGQTGQSTVRVGSIGGFFMRNPVGGGNGNDISVEYIGDDIVSVIGYDPNGTNQTNIVTPVLYR